jgi:transposase
MPAPGKFSEETEARAIRLHLDRVEAGESKLGARRHVGALLDMLPATIRNWVETDERLSGVRPVTDARSAEAQEMRT